MRVRFKHSIYDRVIELIQRHGAENLEFIELTKDEYIQLLEEFHISTAIVWRLEENRKIEGVQLVIAND